MKQGTLRRSIVLAFLALGGIAAAQPPQQENKTGIVLGPDVTILEHADAPGPVKLAAEDLAGDFEKVLGRRPRIVTGNPGNGAVVEIGAPGGGTEESFAIKLSGNRIVLSGADMRGTIFAIYQFSQDWLVVDPMYYWNDHAPARKASIVIPAGFSKIFPSPLFHYRGFFINDEDQLTGWAPGEHSDHSGISKPVMDKIFETILRLKGNMVVPGTWTFSSDPQMKWAGARGLILNQHHAIPVGMNVARWPAKVPYTYSQHPEILQRAWTNAVNAYDPKQEILWSVGLRGLSDTSYATMDPSVVGNDKLLGSLISKAIVDQMRIVRTRFPHAKFVTDLWQEGARLMSKGLMTIPADVTTVWADTGYGVVQDKGQAAKGQGMYYHVAMLNGRANQLSEMVPVDRIYSEFGRYIKAGATEYMLLNTSDIRAVSMTARVVMDTSWGGVPKDGAMGTYGAWARNQFGEKAGAPLAKMWGSYFKAFSHLPTGEDYGDQIYHTEARQLLMSTMITPPWYNIVGQSAFWTPVRILGLNIDPNYGRDVERDYVAKTSERELKACSEAQTRWDAVWKDAKAAEALIPKDRLAYYDAYVLGGIAMNRDGNRMLWLVADAIRNANAGDKAKAHQEVKEALAAIAEIKQVERAAEYGKWKHWYRGEWLVGIDETREMIEYFDRWIDDPLTRLPPPVNSNSWQAYYHIMHYEGGKSADVH
ncbi:MAG TPA: glycosyl hydrolase 115 family protein [Rhizomicrobium sp.]|nr:glycosyl hydrolase 115 family protein [Rhizomicrobium sp.]